ncbi:MAG: hypothetical protein AB7O24_03305 [Kofleriaceae bacterium]
MMKPSLLLLGLIATPAFAQPASPPGATSKPVAQPLHVELTIKTANDVRSHELALVTDPSGRSCSTIKDQTTNSTDSIQVCASGDGRVVRLQVDCEIVRSGTTSYRANWETPVVRGSKIEVGRANTARFTIAMK